MGRIDGYDITGRTVLVTGGAGFIGSHLAGALSRHNDVRVLDNLSTGRRGALPEDVTFIEGDIRDDDRRREAVNGVDLVFHEAAIVSVDQSVDAPTLTHDVNARATLAVLEHARRNDARVVVASSAAVYGEPDRVPVTESQCLTPTSPYGVTKLAADHYTRLYADLYGLETVALRYFNVYGPGQAGGDYNGVISTFVDRAVAGEPLVVHGNGSQTRDFVHVSDVVDANLAAATTDHVGEAFNVGTGTSVTIRELAEHVRRITGADVPIEHDEARSGDVTNSRADLTAARSRLGYEPVITLDEGLATLPALSVV